MQRPARVVIARHWLVIGTWALPAGIGAIAAPRATSALSYDFSLPGRAGYETNQQIVRRFDSGGDNAPVLLVVGDGSAPVPVSAGRTVGNLVRAAAPRAWVTSFDTSTKLRASNGRLGVVLVYPQPDIGAADGLRGVLAVPHP